MVNQILCLLVLIKNKNYDVKNLDLYKLSAVVCVSTYPHPPHTSLFASYCIPVLLRRCSSLMDAVQTKYTVMSVPTVHNAYATLTGKVSAPKKSDEWYTDELPYLSVLIKLQKAVTRLSEGIFSLNIALLVKKVNQKRTCVSSNQQIKYERWVNRGGFKYTSLRQRFRVGSCQQLCSSITTRFIPKLYSPQISEPRVNGQHSKGVANDSLRKKIFLHTNGYGISLEALGPFFKSLGRAIRG